MIEVLVDGEWAEKQPVHGDKYRKTENGSVIISYWNEPNLPTIYEIESLTVTTSGTPAETALTGDYVSNIDEAIAINCVLVGGMSVTYPGAVIKLPVVRHSDGRPTDDEIYFSATIIDGVLNATGSIGRSGDWKLLTSRINKSLDRINAGWHINADDIGFLV
jgi:hypothetical protein